jgi:integrase
VSVEIRRVGKRKTYIVRPPDGMGGRLPAERFFTRRAADEFHDRAADAVKLGQAAIDRLYRNGPTFADYLADVWLEQYASHRAPATYKQYGDVIRLHLAPTFASERLADITVGTVKRWQAERLGAGVGRNVLRRAQIILGQVLQHAVENEVLSTNPVRNVRYPDPRRKLEVRPLAPRVVELVRRQMDPESAAIVSILAYAGLRPAEMRGLRWGDVRERTLLVERQADGDGGTKDTKTSAHRTVRLLAPLADDLAAWRAASGDPAPDRLVIPRAGDRFTWTREDWSNWRERQWVVGWRAAAAQAARDADAEPDAPVRPVTRRLDGRRRETTPPGPRTQDGIDAAVRAGVDPRKVPRPYDLRHSFASLLLAEGRTTHAVAGQMGHSATMTNETYGHVIDEYRDRPAIDAEDEIRKARAAGPATTSPLPRNREDRNA